jgi:hypothetical protein
MPSGSRVHALARDLPWRGQQEEGRIMGFIDDAKDAAEATGKKVGEAFDDAKERVSDKVDEVQADAKVRQAEKERDATQAKNEYKEELRKD